MANNSPDDFKKAEELNERLKQLSISTGIPIPELIRRALALYAIPNIKPSELADKDNDAKK